MCNAAVKKGNKKHARPGQEQLGGWVSRVVLVGGWWWWCGRWCWWRWW